MKVDLVNAKYLKIYHYPSLLLIDGSYNSPERAKRTQNLIQAFQGPQKEVKRNIEEDPRCKAYNIATQLMSVPEQLLGISTNWTTMAELQEGNPSFV